MKIENLIPGVFNLESKESSKLKKKKSSASKVFSAFFEKAQSREEKHFIVLENGEFNLDLIKNMLDEISFIGEKLLSEPSKANIILYKEKISNFISSLIGNSLSLFEERSRIKTGFNSNKYLIVKVINEKLDKLVHNIVINQANQFNLLERLEEIQGLLVDLLK